MSTCRGRVPLRRAERLQIVMDVVPEPKPGTPGVIVMAKPNTPTFRGRSSTDYVCGNCGFVIGAGLEHGSIGPKLLLRCSACSAYNAAGTQTGGASLKPGLSR